MLEPVTEIVSVHGSSEAMDSPGLISDPVPGTSCATRSTAATASASSAAATATTAIPDWRESPPPAPGWRRLITDDHTRQGVREALARRRVYATNGPRILLHATLDDRPMGSESPEAPHPGAEQSLVAMILTERPISRIDIIRSGSVQESITVIEDKVLYRLERAIPTLGDGEYLYLRVLQIDGGAAWSSPFFGPVG